MKFFKNWRLLKVVNLNFVTSKEKINNVLSSFIIIKTKICDNLIFVTLCHSDNPFFVTYVTKNLSIIINHKPK